MNHAIADVNSLARDVTQQPQTSASPAATSPNVIAPSVLGAASSTVSSLTTHGSTTHDPAALDSLARQLYGRFSRHLAGELLVDRERAQFLTDLT